MSDKVPIEFIIVEIRFISQSTKDVYVKFPGTKFFDVFPCIVAHVGNGGKVKILDITGDISVVKKNLDNLILLIGMMYQTGHLEIDMDRFLPTFIEYSSNPIIAAILESELN